MNTIAALRMLLEWGADECLDAQPVNRFHTAAPVPPPGPATTDTVANASASAERRLPGSFAPALAPVAIPLATPFGTPAADRAARVASGCHTLAALAGAITAFEGCALRDTATQAVLPTGDPASGLLLVGEAPSTDDDRSGHPISGQAGTYLDKMLASIGLDRGKLLLVPVIPWRPPGDRPPSTAEINICLPFLQRLIVLVRPDWIVLLGPLAARALARGTRRPQGWVELDVPGLEAPVPALLTHGPAQLLRTPSLRPRTWADLRLLRRTLDTALAAK